MKPRRVTLGYMPKTSVIRFRCDPELAARFERVALLRRREEADLARIWFEDMLLAEEQRLGLILSTQPHAALREISSTHPEAMAANQIVAAVETSYGKTKRSRKPRK